MGRAVAALQRKIFAPCKKILRLPLDKAAKTDIIKLRSIQFETTSQVGDNMDYNPLLLENQLCFPLYAVSREVVKKYKPFLDAIGLTYTQYIAMLALWEKKSLSMKDLGKMLYLDSGTLTPLLKKLERNGLVHRTRLPQDERNVMVTLTQKGEALQQDALEIPAKIGSCINLAPQDAKTLHRILHAMLGA